VISPFAKQNFVDHTLTDQSSIIHFIEVNWRLGGIGNSSYDALSGSIENMFDFNKAPVSEFQKYQTILDPSTGLVVAQPMFE